MMSLKWKTKCCGVSFPKQKPTALGASLVFYKTCDCNTPNFATRIARASLEAGVVTAGLGTGAFALQQLGRNMIP